LDIGASAAHDPETRHLTGKTMTAIHFTQITAHNCDLTKRFSHNEQGKLESTAIAHMTEGRARICTIEDITQLDILLQHLLPNQAITCGVPRVGNTDLTTRAGVSFHRNAVARTNEEFDWLPGPALCPIDVDVEEGAYHTLDAVLDVLEACHPWLAHITRIARPSSSSFVDGRGLRGVHVYFAVTRGVDIPDLATRMQAEQWLANRGYIKISKSGALLVRQVSDAMVYQPSRLMFEATPVLSDGVTRDIPEGQRCVVRDRAVGAPMKARTADGLLDVPSLTPLRDINVRRYQTAVKNAKNSRRREAKKIAINYQKDNAIANGLPEIDGERYGLMATRALGDKKLPATWTIFVKDIGRQTVQQIVDAGEDALGFQCADPFDSWRIDLEPKHFTKAEIVMMGDKPGIWSHKLQEFFEFTDERSADLDTPIALAAEKLCGLVEYPEPSGKRAAPAVNVTFGLSLLLKEIGAMPYYDACRYRAVDDDVPEQHELMEALSRIGCYNVSYGAIEKSLEALAKSNTMDLWRDAVARLPQWDGVARLDTFFTDLCGALPTDALSLTGQVLFAGALQRQLKPGAPCPVIPVLIGPGGTGKSRFVGEFARALGVPPPAAITFSEDIKMTMAASVSAVAELAEMSGMGRRDMDDIKQWTTECEDVYRAPYERAATAHPRRFVLIGTANKHELNRDETGNRRLQPVDVLQPIDPNWSIEAPQLFAEAKARFCSKDGDYERLITKASDAVFAFNQAQMHAGVGTVVSDADDVLPNLLKKLVEMRGPKLQSSWIRDALDQTISGRGIRTRDYTKWLQSRGWRAGRTSAARYYEAPPAVLDELEEEKSTLPISPFTKARELI
jgi:hypothetical protein